ncbi:DUF2157 domain-containing protein [Olivibacter sp. CPCC 100613]|uniref:DUF2157 domain-containing protein n=1 Tax=Olivibacter sp. CPCC 100613 TaxID=3079931 RepID=UPI002FFAF112
MKNMEREDIHLISRHSTLSQKGIAKALREKVYPTSESWFKFLKLFFFVFGIGFSLLGIVFFFAYNWTALHKFVKLGLVEGLIIITMIIALLPQIDKRTRNLMITGCSLLIGVLFALFGQIYQTGANAYDFFLAWTLFITLWVLVTDFSPLWLLYFLLINTTLILYQQQVAADWSVTWLFTLLFLINGTVLITSTLIQRFRIGNLNIPIYFLNIMALATVTFATSGLIGYIFQFDWRESSLLILSYTPAFLGGIYYGIKIKSGFYLSVLPFSLIVLISALLVKISENEWMFLLISIFIMASATLVVRNLIHMHKEQPYEKQR